jgi:hypothetical protein
VRLRTVDFPAPARTMKRDDNAALTRRVFVYSTLPPLIFFSGHRLAKSASNCLDSLLL